jgi:CrcB protein
MPDWFNSFISHPVTVLTIGGAAGTNARYWLGALIRQAQGTAVFPWPTFAINVSGSILLGFAAALFLKPPEDPRRIWYLLLGTGFCGGFTTFSTFSLETLALMQSGRPWTAAAYVAGSVSAGVLGVAVGIKLLGERA